MKECFKLKREQMTNSHKSHKFKEVLFFFSCFLLSDDIKSETYITVHNSPTTACSSCEVMEGEDYEVGLIVQ